MILELISPPHCKNAQYFYKISIFFSVIQTGFEDISVSLIALDRATQYEDNLGHITIPLNRINDQMKHEEWYDFYDSSGELTQYKVLLGLQWIFSKVSSN